MQANTAMAHVTTPYPYPQKEDEPKKPHISQSQLNLYTGCAEAYRRRYIEVQNLEQSGRAFWNHSGIAFWNHSGIAF